VEEVEPPVASSGAPEDGKATPAAAPSEPVAATTASPVSSTACPPSDSMAVSYKPDAAKKAGDMVYLQSKTEQTVCVVDASGAVQNKTLTPGVGASVYGKPPLKVLTSGESQVDMYYQGMKVRLSNVTAKIFSWSQLKLFSLQLL